MESAWKGGSSVAMAQLEEKTFIHFRPNILIDFIDKDIKKM